MRDFQSILAMYSILSLVTFLSNDIRYLELSRAAALSGYSLLSQLLYLKEAIINVVLQVKSSLSPESITSTASMTLVPLLTAHRPSHPLIRIDAITMHTATPTVVLRPLPFSSHTDGTGTPTKALKTSNTRVAPLRVNS